MAPHAGPQDRDLFHRTLADARARMDLLRRRVRERGPRDPEALVEELLTAHEELQVTEDELRVRNEELALSEAALETERLRYWELFQQAPDAYLVTDARGIILEANHAACALLNVPARRLDRRPLGVFVPGEARRDFRTRLALAAELGRLDDWETALQPRRRAPVEVACTVAAVRDPAGGVQALRWLLRDVTERRRAEASHAALLREEAARAEAEAARARLEAVVRAMPGGVLIADAPEGCIVMHNAEAERILGRAIRPLPLSRYAERGLMRLDGTPLPAEEYALARSLLRGETVSDLDLLHRRGDGTLATLRVSSAPVRGPDGAIVAAVATFTDVTEALRAARTEHFLAQVTEVLASSLEPREVLQQVARVCAGSLADYCIVHVEEGSSFRAAGIAHADPARETQVRDVLRAFPVPVNADQPVMRVLRSGTPELISPVDDAALEDMTIGPEHREAVRALGVTSAIVVPIRAKGRTLGAVSLARTGGDAYGAQELAVAEELARRAALAVENARLYDQARQAVRARDEVVAVVSHDLRNPLNAVLIASTVLAEYGGMEQLAERDRKQVQIIRRAAEQMTSLTQDLLEVSALESGSMSMQPRACPTGPLLRAVEEMFAPVADDEGVALAVGAADELPAAHADYGRVLQVFGNLVGNAIKFTPEGGRVELGAECTGEWLRFWVRDTGPGIEPEHLPRLFDRFWQARRGGGAGAGLGLAIARSIVEAHGGQIWAESGSGGGSTFHFTLPVAAE